MNNKINLIFDFDGTLFDSYDSIVDWLYRSFKYYGIDVSKEVLRERAIFKDVGYAIDKTCAEYKIEKEKIEECLDTLSQNLDLIVPYNNILNVLKNENYNCFIYTHRGTSANVLVEKFNLQKYFIEVVDGTYNLKHKPDPDGINYLINKYHLDKNNTYYIGDRKIDILCGNSANVKTIFFNSSRIELDIKTMDYIIFDFDEINEKLMKTF